MHWPCCAKLMALPLSRRLLAHSKATTWAAPCPSPNQRWVAPEPSPNLSSYGRRTSNFVNHKPSISKDRWLKISSVALLPMDQYVLPTYHAKGAAGGYAKDVMALNRVLEMLKARKLENHIISYGYRKSDQKTIKRDWECSNGWLPRPGLDPTQFRLANTGGLQGKPTWGTFWVSDARLISLFILFLIYLGALHFQNLSVEPSPISIRAEPIDIQIIKSLVNWWNTLHQPGSISRSAQDALSSSLFAEGQASFAQPLSSLKQDLKPIEETKFSKWEQNFVRSKDEEIEFKTLEVRAEDTIYVSQ
ncbi:putative cytochrome c biosynthesis ccmC-like mitochondrial protein [Capsicum annuum]|nr:putative cytochrome c biosynthesis ccmC-like mitochondrial protein [Capsicum annuum]